MNNKLLFQIAWVVSYSAILCFPALADQCSYLKKEQALTAISRLDVNETIYKLCEPCGEKSTHPTLIKTLSMEKVDYEDYWQIKVNEKGIDLAYVFIDSNIENKFVNLAAIADCPAQQVSPLLPSNSIKPKNKIE